MSRLRELIAELCPDGVEYKALGEVSITIVDGSHKAPPQYAGQDAMMMLSAKNVISNAVDDSFGRPISPKDHAAESKRVDTHKGDVLLTIVGAIGRTAVIANDTKYAFQRSVCVIKPDMSQVCSEYVAHALQHPMLQHYMTNNAKGAAQKGFYLKQVAALRIPVPPIEVQREVVRILDEYTAAHDELVRLIGEEIRVITALEGQLKQRVFERALNDSVDNPTCPVYRMNRLFEIRSAKRIAANDQIKEGVPFYRLADIGALIDGEDVVAQDYISEEHYHSLLESGDVPTCGDILMTSRGTLGKCLIVDGTQRFYFQDGMITWLKRTDASPDSRYITALFAIDNYVQRLINGCSGTTVKYISIRDLNDFEVPVPSIDDQKNIAGRVGEIASTVDSMVDTLVVERGYHEQQLALVRNQILSFPEKVS